MKLSRRKKVLYDSIGIRVKFDLPDNFTTRDVDQEKIQHAILCICKNAVEAMPSGGVLTFRGYESDGAVFLEIGDTGAGIPKGLEVFEPFQTTKPLSSGLGLPIVSQIISAHNGTIDYVSEPGKGTTFKIGLPAEAELLMQDELSLSCSMRTVSAGSCDNRTEVVQAHKLNPR